MLEIVVRETLSKTRQILRLHWEIRDTVKRKSAYRRSQRTFGNSLDCYADLGKVVGRAWQRGGRITGVPKRLNRETMILFLDPNGREHQGTGLTVGNWLDQKAHSEGVSLVPE